jgi:hypothetical protein
MPNCKPAFVEIWVLGFRVYGFVELLGFRVLAVRDLLVRKARFCKFLHHNG